MLIQQTMTIPAGNRWFHPMRREFGQRVRHARRLRKINQYELAARVGITQPTISAIENGGQEGTKYLMELARALRVRPDWLQFGSGLMELDGDIDPRRQEFINRMIDATKKFSDERFELFVKFLEDQN